jgi:ribosomal protein S18 acetylase RimI-like enzyme
VIRVEADPWLAEVLRRDVFKVSVGAGGLSHPGWRLTDALPEAGRRETFCYARAPAERIDLVRLLSAGGFGVVDVSLTLERPPGPGLSGREQPAVRVRDAAPADHNTVLASARSCFVYSRFHLDPLVPREAADRVKEEWVRSYLFGKRGERLLVAESEGMPAGFLAVLAAEHDGMPVRVIDLIGVGKQHQGRGVGRSLVHAFIAEYGSRCLLRVGTQAANIPSLRLYEQCGFRLTASAYVLHAHVKDGQVRNEDR